MKRLPWVLLALVFAAQWAVPVSMWHKREVTLREGQTFRFRTAPVDPADPLLGRYVALNLEAARITLGPGEGVNYRRDDRVILPLIQGSDGYAVLGQPQSQPPAGAWLQAPVQWVNGDELFLALPFDRYYMNERQAPQAELAYLRAGRRTQPAADQSVAPPRPDTYVQVRVRKGFGVIEELYLDGVPVLEYLQRDRESVSKPVN